METKTSKFTKDQSNLFIQQTSRDYDMSYEEVEKIKKLNPSAFKFYEKLEEYISNRANG